MLDNNTFYFRQFSVKHHQSSFKVGFDGVLLGAWCNTAYSAKILDIGTGTGLLALMAAQKNSNAEITGIEPDEHSYSEAEFNFRNSPWNDRLEVFNTSLQDFRISSLQKYDHIICNPPYFSNSLPPPSDLKKNTRHTIMLSHSELLEYSHEILENKGKLSVILPYNEGIAFIGKGKSFNFGLSRHWDVYTSKNERVLIELTKGNCIKTEYNLLKIYTGFEQYSDEYISLVRDFYINF